MRKTSFVQDEQAPELQAGGNSQAPCLDSTSEAKSLRDVTRKTFTEEQLRNGRRWVDALRSGKYEQCKGGLHIGKGFCCLGVACDVLEPGGWEKGGTDYFYFGDEISYLPGHIATALGVTRYGALANNASYDSLTKRNDAGTSFSDIADIIEREIYHGLLPTSASEAQTDSASDSQTSSEKVETTSVNSVATCDHCNQQLVDNYCHFCERTQDEEEK